jgi:hypothetical protein
MKTICSSKRCGRVLPLLLLPLPLAIGCGSQTKGTVSGTVTYQGKPLHSGFVTFVVENGAPLHTEIQSNGSYRLDKVPVGPVKIGIRPKSAGGKLQSTPMPRNRQDFAKAKSAMTESDTPIPPKYADPNKSELTYTVTKGPQQNDIVLK